MKSSLLAFSASDAVHSQLHVLLTDLKLGADSLIRGDERQAIEYLATQPSPALLLLEMASHDNRSDTLSRLADVVEPDCQVILLGAELPLSEYRDIKALGVLEYFETPLDMFALRHLCAHRLGMADTPVRGQSQGRIISVSGIQGGVGTTSVAAVLAQQLAAQGSHTLLGQLDDEWGDLGDFWPNRTLAPVALEQLSQAQLIARATENLAPRLDWLSSSEASWISDEQCHHLNNLLAQQYTRVVWDCEKHHVLAPALWAQADICVWVMEPTVALVDQWHRLQKRLSAHQHQRHIYVVNQTRPERVKQLPVEQLNSLLDHTPVVIPYCKEQPVFAANLGDAEALNSGKFAQAIAQVVDKIQLRSSAQKPDSRSLLRRLLGGTA